MSDTTPNADAPTTLTRAFRYMPGWKMTLIGVSLMVGIVGVAGQIVAGGLRHTAPVAQTGPTHPAAGGAPAVAPPGASGFADGGSPAPTVSADSPSASPNGAAAAQQPTLTDKITPYLSKGGFSLFVGVIVGLIFRTFIRMATALSIVIVALIGTLSYYHVINVDMGSVRDQAGATTGWLTTEGMRIKDLIFQHVPLAGPAGLGFLFGMKRR